MFHLYKLQAKAWWSNPFAKTEFLTTTIFLLVFGSVAAFVFQDKNNTEATFVSIQVISTITVMMIMNVAMYSFGFSFFEMKESVLLKRIGATKISKPKAIMSFALWGMTTMVMMVLFIGVVVAFCQIPGTNESGILYILPSFWENIFWPGVLAAMLLTGLSFLPIALLFVSISKNSEIYNIMTTFYMFIFVFIGMGAGADGRGWMDVIGYLSPMGWTSELMANSMLGQNVFDISNIWALNKGVLEQVPTWIAAGDFIFPVLFGAAATGGCMKWFKWD